MKLVPMRSHAEARGSFPTLKPLDMQDLAAMGNKAFEAGRFEEARTFYLQAIEAGPKAHVAILTWERLGDCELKLGGTKEKAHEYYREAIRALPNEIWARNAQADILDKMGSFEAANMLREEAGKIERGEMDKY